MTSMITARMKTLTMAAQPSRRRSARFVGSISTVQSNWPPFASIFQSGADRQQRSHRRLQNDPKDHRPAYAVTKILPNAGQEILHVMRYLRTARLSDTMQRSALR